MCPLDKVIQVCSNDISHADTKMAMPQGDQLLYIWHLVAAEKDFKKSYSGESHD